MSEFDKEAEREKLREQFAEDERKRETTQRMSELLLKGATMTNKHCDDCGDPIFRWQDEEFCPTCSAEGERVRQQAQQQAQQAQQAQQETQHSREGDGEAPPSAEASDGARPDTPQRTPDPEEAPEPADAQVDVPLDDAGSASGDPAEGAPPASAPTDGASPSGPTPTPASPSTADSQSAQQSTASRSSEATDVPSASGQITDLATARESLGRTVTRFAREAEASDDLARAREYLTAVEDAADALAAVRRAER